MVSKHGTGAASGLFGAGRPGVRVDRLRRPRDSVHLGDGAEGREELAVLHPPHFSIGSGSSKLEVYEANQRSPIALHCFLIHARNLLDFFCGPARLLPTDLIAADFFPKSVPWQTPRVPRTLWSVRKRMNRLLAHLTIHRLTYEKKDTPRQWRWPCPKMEEELLGLWERFLRTLPPDRADLFTRKPTESRG